MANEEIGIGEIWHSWSIICALMDFEGKLVALVFM